MVSSAINYLTNFDFMEIGFNDFYWHDAIITEVTIDRNNPGKNDIILFEIEFPDIGKCRLVFIDVYWAKLDLNFGIVAPESISKAFIANETDGDLTRVSSLWKQLIPKLEAFCYVIELNSTGGEIKIIAKGFSVS